MRIKCIDNRPEAAKGTHKYLGEGSGNNSPVYLLTPGKEYVVYAIAEIDHEKMYLVLNDSQQPADTLLKHWGEPDPVWYDAKLFEVVNQAIDPAWKKKGSTMWGSVAEVWSFPEFAEDPATFYHWLIEGRGEEVSAFLKYLKRYETVESLVTARPSSK